METLALNRKIEKLIVLLGFSNSKFADYIDVSRPIISHIIAGRNKPSLEIVQKIIKKFPELGIDWTYDVNDLDEELLIRIANEISKDREAEKIQLLEDSIAKSSGNSQPDLFDMPVNPISESSGKKITKIVVFFDDNSFTEYKPS